MLSNLFLGFDLHSLMSSLGDMRVLIDNQQSGLFLDNSRADIKIKINTQQRKGSVG